MKKLRILLPLLLLFFVGCSHVKEQNRVSSQLQVKEFNSLASKYYSRPTFVAVNLLNTGKKSLLIQVDPYRPRQYDVKSMMSFGEDYANQYITLIDKYLEWENKASQRGDQFEKKIGSVDDGTGILDLTFKFYSGNAYNHFLVISNCDIFCVETSDHHYYDKNNALILKDLIKQLKNGQLKVNKISDVYN